MELEIRLGVESELVALRLDRIWDRVLLLPDTLVTASHIDSVVPEVGEKTRVNRNVNQEILLLIDRVAQIGSELGREHVIVWRCLARRHPLEDWLSFGSCPNLDCSVGRGDPNNRRVLANERIKPAKGYLFHNLAAHRVASIDFCVVEALISNPGIISQTTDESIVCEVKVPFGADYPAPPILVESVQPIP